MKLATLFLKEMLVNIKTRHFHSCINRREQLFHRALIAGYFRPRNIAKFLRTRFFIEQLHRCFPVKLAKYIRTPFPTEHLQ